MRTKTERSEIKPRTPINGARDILKVEGIPEDLHPCWVNDYNVERFLDAGYSFWDINAKAIVGDESVNSASGLTDRRFQKPVGNGVTAYLMVIPVEFYKEDMDSIHREIDEKEAIMFRSMKQGDGRYGDVKVEHGSRKT